MLYLLGSIVLTSYLTLAFKVVERFHVNNLHAIVFNYITCVITGSFVNGSFPITSSITKQPWFPWALLMGAVFISLFNLVAFTAQKIAVSVATVANKLSLVVPFIFSIYYYQEPLGVMKMAGILTAIAAVIFTCYRRRNDQGDKKAILPGAMFYILPLLLFAGSGLLDTMIKYVEQDFLNSSNYNSYLVTAFTAAGSIGILLLLFFIITGRQRFSYKSVLAGIAIGVPNYFSIWCLLKVLKQHTGESAVIIPLNNMGIVLFSTVTAWLVFREQLTLTNWLGIILSILSIILIAFQ
jgi:drug/metabolite transporter (DMT)-like permease